MKTQWWLRWWLGAIRQQAITWANVDPDLCHHMASLSQNELKALVFLQEQEYGKNENLTLLIRCGLVITVSFIKVLKTYTLIYENIWSCQATVVWNISIYPCLAKILSSLNYQYVLDNRVKWKETEYLEISIYIYIYICTMMLSLFTFQMDKI